MVAVKQALKALSAPLHSRPVGLHWWILASAVLGNVVNTGDGIAVERRKPVFIATAYGWKVINRFGADCMLFPCAVDNMDLHWSCVFIDNPGFPFVLGLLDRVTRSKVLRPSFVPCHVAN